jgi:hypothetical protein
VTVIESNDDLYDAVRTLADDLEAVGDGARADQLRDALAISTLPGELLGEIRNRLRALAQSDSASTLDGRHRIAEALAYLDGVLDR